MHIYCKETWWNYKWAVCSGFSGGGHMSVPRVRIHPCTLNTHTHKDSHIHSLKSIKQPQLAAIEPQIYKILTDDRTNRKKIQKVTTQQQHLAGKTFFSSPGFGVFPTALQMCGSRHSCRVCINRFSIHQPMFIFPFTVCCSWGNRPSWGKGRNTLAHLWFRDAEHHLYIYKKMPLNFPL